MTGYMGPRSTRAGALEAASPDRLITVGGNLPPFILVHGAADQVVPGSQSQKLFRRSKEAGHAAADLVAVGLNHGFHPLSIADTLRIENEPPYRMELTEQRLRAAPTPSTCGLISFLSAVLYPWRHHR